MALNDEFLEDWNWHLALGRTIFVDWTETSTDEWEDYNYYWDIDF